MCKNISSGSHKESTDQPPHNAQPNLFIRSGHLSKARQSQNSNTIHSSRHDRFHQSNRKFPGEI